MAETSASRTAHSGMVTGLFPDRETAERAYGSIVKRGYGQDDVNLVMSDETRKKHLQSMVVRLSSAVRHSKARGRGRQSVAQ